MGQPLRIVMISSECVPFAKTGGLADVVGALPKVLQAMGHQVIVIMPKYDSINYLKFKLRPFLTPLGVWMGGGEEWCSIHTTDYTGFPVYLVESNKYFDRSGLYHDANFNDYLDNPRRFGFLSRAGLEFCKVIGFTPDIVHTHDWHTAPACAYLKIWHWDDGVLSKAASVLTIHNIAYQGVYPAEHYSYLGLQWGNFVPDKFEDHGKMNLLKGGIHYADMVNTVSPSYARETRTPELAHGLAPYLNNKGENYVGILNGVDYAEWDPSVDKHIRAAYNARDVGGKALCKLELQKRFNLEVNPNMALIGVVSRFASQKGLDLLAQSMDGILNGMKVQFVVLGSGDKALEAFYGALPGRYPGRVGAHIGYSDELSHWIEAGADFLIMPSIYEPCGLNQIYSLRYGTLPIVRATGGLDDTVQQYDEASGAGTGFKFWEPSVNAIYYTVGWAVSTYYDRPQHILKMMQAGMGRDYSWERSAEAYVRLYERALANKPK